MDYIKNLYIVQTEDLSVFEVVLNRSITKLENFEIVIEEEIIDVVFTGDIQDCEAVVRVFKQTPITFSAEIGDVREEEIPEEPPKEEIPE